MPTTDPIADLLTRIRNASRARHEKVSVPASRLKLEVARVLKEEGYIRDVVRHAEPPQDSLTILLKYAGDGEPAIADLHRVSRPGLRRYVPAREIPRVLNGLGVAILSTSRGVMADRQARKAGVGGEILCTVS